MDRTEAKRLGLKTYETGIPCPHGHIAPRYTSTGNCKECCRVNAMRNYKPITSKKRAYNNGISFIEAAQKLHNGTYTYEHVVYINAHTPVQITCPIHGVFLQTPTNHMCGRRCPKCAALATKLASMTTNEEFIEKANKVWKGAFTYEKLDYQGAKVPIRVTCTTHPNDEIWQTPTNHLGGKNPCTKCGAGASLAEDSLYEYVKQYAKIRRHARDIIPPYEVDLWLPEHNLAIEYHGLYWHSTERVGMKHREKWQVSAENNIRLIQIFEDEWLDNPEVVKARIRALLGVGVKTHARKTTMRVISFKEARMFLEARHTQGAGVACLAYGLYSDEKLVAVATFGKSRTGGMTADKTKNVWEVYRYASEGTVVGGFSKMLKQFIKDINPEKIISYCDLRYGNGSLYKSTGFTLESITEADYWWVPKGQIKRIPRYQTQKHKLANHPVLKEYYSPTKTENEICAEAGWRKIHGVGNQKWVMHLT